MNDLIYLGFAQLSYLDWHNIDKNSILEKVSNLKLKSILENADTFNQIKTPDYGKKGMSDKSNNYCEKLENGKKIYNKADARLFYLYSEHLEDPDELANKKFPEFQEWEFVEGFDHTKLQTLDFNNPNNKKKHGKINNRFDSDFQASVFKKGNQIMIALRGSDKLSGKHLKGDWLTTNFELGFNHMADQLACKAMVCDYVGNNLYL